MKPRIRCIHILIVLGLLGMFTPHAVAGTYWVSPSGSANWSSCSGSAKNGSAACSLTTANKNAVAGDTIFLRGGTYNIADSNSGIFPSNSGSAGKMITYKAYNDENVVFTGSKGWGIYLSNDDYISILGIKFVDLERLAQIQNDSDHVEIGYCDFINSSDFQSRVFFKVNSACGGTDWSCGVDHMWLHHNTFMGGGHVSDDCEDRSSTLQLGAPNDKGDECDYFTIENNYFTNGGHHTMETYGRYGVVRNNVSHNEGWMVDKHGCNEVYHSKRGCFMEGDAATGLYGNRNYSAYRGSTGMKQYTLIEGNRFGHAGIPPDDDGSRNLAVGGNYYIIRYNSLFNAAGTGMYFRDKASYCATYNNTIYRTGFGNPQRVDLDRSGLIVQYGATGHEFVNNLVFETNGKDINCVGGGCQPEDVGIWRGNWDSFSGNPIFMDPDVSNPKDSATKPDLSLQDGSKAINSGSYLTLAKNSGANSTTLKVGNALFFQDGSWGSDLSGIKADWIAIDSPDNVAQIKSVDYSGNTIYLDTPVSWSTNSKIWLYKSSAGQVVLVGPAPDVGSHESGSTSIPPVDGDDGKPVIPGVPPDAGVDP